jgi:glycosyltransferase involved in cell wall biosynthesis
MRPGGMRDSGIASVRKPTVSIVCPVYNEAALLEKNVEEVLAYTATLRDSYDFEIVIVNDGSRDDSGEIAERLAGRHEQVRVGHHPTNFGVGQALRYGFSLSTGDYVIVLDVDLSYSPDHIGRLLDRMVQTRAKLVLASPYMEGGQLTNVPPVRRFFSIWGNRFLRLLARGNLSTLTSMVRAYDGPFLRGLVLRSTGLDLMPEVIYKTMVLKGRIDEIPAHLDWSKQVAAGPARRSSMRIIGHIFSTVLSGFIFRPVAFLILPGLAVLLFSLYVNAWMFVHYFDAFVHMDPAVRTASAAFASAYAAHPHTFIVALLSLMLAIQLVGLGILAMQAQRYFEELFYMGTSLKRSLRSQDAAQGRNTTGRRNSL